jgi:hypothetical protein
MIKIRIGVCACTQEAYRNVFEGVNVGWRATKLSLPQAFVLTQRLVPEGNDRDDLTIMRPHFFFDSHALSTRRGVSAIRLSRLDVKQGRVSVAKNPRPLAGAKTGFDSKNWTTREVISQEVLISSVRQLLKNMKPHELAAWLERMGNLSGSDTFVCHWR